jgi:hypothetical protein
MDHWDAGGHDAEKLEEEHALRAPKKRFLRASAANLPLAG